MNGPASILIKPGQDFYTNYSIKGPLNQTMFNSNGTTVQDSYLAGYLNPSTAATNFVLQDTSGSSITEYNIISSVDLGTHPQGGNIFELKDVNVNKIVTNMLCIMIASPDVAGANTEFFFSHVRPGYPDVKSERRKVILSESTESLQII